MPVTGFHVGQNLIQIFRSVQLCFDIRIVTFDCMCDRPGGDGSFDFSSVKRGFPDFDIFLQNARDALF